MVVIGVSSQKTIAVEGTNGTIETHPRYRITPSRAAPSQSIGIALTPDAPDQIAGSAFDFRLSCVWSLGGCRRWNQLLPAVQPLLRGECRQLSFNHRLVNESSPSLITEDVGRRAHRRCPISLWGCSYHAD
jgi:hypothetical protein